MKLNRFHSCCMSKNPCDMLMCMNFQEGDILFMQEYKEIISYQIIPQKWGNCLGFGSLFKISGNRILPQILHSNNLCTVSGKTFVRHNPINARWKNCLKIFFLTHLLIILGKLTLQFLVLAIMPMKLLNGILNERTLSVHNCGDL